MDEESKKYNAKAMKAILNGLPNSVKNNLGKYSSAKDIWDKLHDLHSKGALTMTINQEGDPEPIIEAENENDDIKAEADLKDEENEKDFVEELLAQLMTAMEEINNLKKENEALKKIALDSDQDQTSKKVDLIKLQVQERDEELAKLKKEFHQSKRKHHEEVISMTNQLNKAKKQQNTLSSQLDQRHKSVNKLEEEIGQYKVEVSSLKSQLQEARKQAQGAEKRMESSQAKNEEIFKMKLDIISLKIVAAEATRSKEETQEQLAKKNSECERLQEEIVLLRKKVEGMNKILKRSQALDDMLSYHRIPSDKLGLGYAGESSNKNENASNKRDMKKTERNGNAPSSNEGKEKNQGYNRTNPAPRRKPAPRRNVDDDKDARGNGYHQRISRQKGFRSTSRKPPSPRYQMYFSKTPILDLGAPTPKDFNPSYF